MATVTFLSKYPKHEIVRFPRLERPTAMGQWVQENNGVRYPFERGLDRETGRVIGILTVQVGQDKSTMDHHGTLRAGEPVGVERDAVEFLRAHRAFVADPAKGSGDFWEAGHAPGTLYPRPADMRKDIRLAMKDLDEDGLVEMIEREKATHVRADLLEEAQDALGMVRDVRAQIAAAQAEQEAEQASEGEPAPKKAPKKAPAAA